MSQVESFNPRNILRGGKLAITSSRLMSVGEGLIQVECGMGQNGFAVRLDKPDTAEFIAAMFQRAAESLRRV